MSNMTPGAVEGIVMCIRHSDMEITVDSGAYKDYSCQERHG